MENPFQDQNPAKEDKVQSVEVGAQAGANLSPPAGGLKKFGFRLFLGGIFVLLILFLVLSFVFYFWRQEKIKDELINFVPLDSVFYVSLRETVWPKPKLKISSLPFSGFYQQLQKKEIFSRSNFFDLLDNSQRVSIALVLNEDDNLDFVYIFKLKNPEIIKSLNLSHQFIIGKNILVVADSQNAIEKIKAVKENLIFSLASQIDSKKIQTGLVNFYLAKANLNFYLSQHQESLNNIFAQLVKDDIYLQLDYQASQWQFKLNQNNFDSAIDKRDELVRYLPNDFSLFVSGVNLFNFFSAWLSYDLTINQSFVQTAAALKTVYNFDFNETLNSLLNQTADLIIFNRKAGNNFLGFDFILVLPNFSLAEINNFEELIKMVLAQKRPQEVNHFLPDGSKVIEFLAKTDKWQWQKEVFDNFEISYLPEPALNFEISYLPDNYLFISNSSDLLKKFVSTRDIDLNRLISQCYLRNDYQKSLIINTQDNFLGLKDYLSAGRLVFIEEKNGITGCFLGLK